MNMQALLRQAQKMQKDIAKVESEANECIYDSTIGGGVIKVSVKGSGVIENIEIDESLLDKESKEDLQDMLKSVINEAIHTATKDKEKKMNAVTAGVKLPGGF